MLTEYEFHEKTLTSLDVFILVIQGLESLQLVLRTKDVTDVKKNISNRLEEKIYNLKQHESIEFLQKFLILFRGYYRYRIGFYVDTKTFVKDKLNSPEFLMTLI